MVEAEGPGSKIVSLFGTETILVVDDDMDIRQLTREALEACGYKVLAAASAEEALIVYADKGQPIHLVILDLNMPDMGGQQCLNELLRIDPEARVLIASGYTAAGQAKGVLEVVAGFVEKPYQFEDLLAKVREVLNG
ncbi:MAG TPA: response regulator [Desulfonatronum sp.]|nr:response regulator [Desulfonatronum sp.]